MMTKQELVQALRERDPADWGHGAHTIVQIINWLTGAHMYGYSIPAAEQCLKDKPDLYEAALYYGVLDPEDS